MLSLFRDLSEGDSEQASGVSLNQHSTHGTMLVQYPKKLFEGWPAPLQFIAKLHLEFEEFPTVGT